MVTEFSYWTNYQYFLYSHNSFMLMIYFLQFMLKCITLAQVLVTLQ